MDSFKHAALLNTVPGHVASTTAQLRHACLQRHELKPVNAHPCIDCSIHVCCRLLCSGAPLQCRLPVSNGHTPGLLSDSWHIWAALLADTCQLSFSSTGPGPAARMGHSAVLFEHTLVIFGGRISPAQPLDDVWALDLASWSWRSIACKGGGPAARFRHTAVACGSRLKVSPALPLLLPLPLLNFTVVPQLQCHHTFAPSYLLANSVCNAPVTLQCCCL